ncbi:MAG: Ig-like domain-containing protein [Pirellulaceae bacterium]
MLLNQIPCTRKNRRRTSSARSRRLRAPEVLETRALPGGNLLEFLLGAPLPASDLTELWADGGVRRAHALRRLAARSEWTALATAREEKSAFDSLWDECRDLLQILSADEKMTELYLETAQQKVRNVADALLRSTPLDSTEFLSDLWWIDELSTSLADAQDVSIHTSSYGSYPPNAPPVAYDDPYFQTKHDTTRTVSNSESVLNNDYDANYGTVLTASLVSGPSHAASFTLNSNGTFTYTPAYHFVGSDNFTYRASDGQYTDDAVVTISVWNFPPQANHDLYEARHDKQLIVSAPGVEGNDSSPDGDPMTAILVSPPLHAATNGFHFHPDGSFDYTPAPYYVGTDNFTYKLNDGIEDSNIATVVINVLNNGPQAQDDLYTASFRTELVVKPRGVLANDTDLDGDPFSAIKVTDPSHGTLTLNSDGSFRYRPTGDYLGRDQFTYQANDGMNDGNIATVTINVVRPLVDIDTDSDNTTAVERSQYEDDEEMKDPGCLVWKDYFDFNANGTHDRLESGPLLNSAGQPVSNASLKPAHLAWNSLGVDLKDFTLQLFAGANTRLYSSQAKHPLATTYRIGRDQVPSLIWVEGYQAGPSRVDWVLKNPAGTEVNRDTVKFTVVWVDAVGYRPQTEGPGYGDPFARTEVPPHLEDTPGMGIRRNGDDDNGNQIADRLDAAVTGENDLIEVRCNTEPAAPPPGVEFRAKRTNQNIAAYNGANKAGPWYSGTNNEIAISSSPKTGWMEWQSMDPQQTGANLELYVWDATHRRRFDAPDVLHFFPFNSVVIVLGGEDQVPSDPPPAEHGVFGIATDLYRNGYDVHMYDEDAVSSVGADYPPVGHPNQEVIDARTVRGVTQVAVFGYSHGGGSTYLLAHRLSTVNNLSLDFTAYVDAVSDSNGDLDMRQEQRRPPSSAFHANYFQQGVLNPLEPGFDYGLDGGPMINPAPGDFEINVETQPADNPWDPNATHYSIDNAQWANGVGRVYQDLSERLQTRIAR